MWYGFARGFRGGHSRQQVVRYIIIDPISYRPGVIREKSGFNRFHSEQRINYSRKAKGYVADISPDMSPVRSLALSKPALLLQLWNNR